MPDKMNRIYSATYSNVRSLKPADSASVVGQVKLITVNQVPVYEYGIGGNHVMRRRADDWINATHILKVADFDKPARTRILEREVQKGVHEKVQGGYGKYQGTWIPLEEGRSLAERNGVLGKLLPIFDYVPGDRSPPPAPKHATAVSAKPKPVRQSQPPPRIPVPLPPPIPEEQYSAMYHVHETPDKASTMTDSDDEMVMGSQYSTSRKRKRGFEEAPAVSFADHQHLLWTDELLDYFMLQNSNEPLPLPPEPPATIDLNRPVDDKGHTPMHWAAAMGDITVVKDLIRRGARIDCLAANGESPLMRAVMFTNNWDKQTMDRLINILHPTAGFKDWFGSTVFHHIAVTTCSKSKYQCARYYLDKILTKLVELYPREQISKLLDQQDQNGDTAIFLAAKFGARKCARTLINFGASVDLPNSRGEMADELIKDLNARRRDRYRAGSSSPFVDPVTGLSTHHRSSSGPPHNGYLPLNRERSNTYRSEAATLLSQQLPTLISSRAEALASALEAELADRELEATDAERLLEQRRREIEHLQQQSLALASRDEDDGFDERQRAELDDLLRESERLLDLEQSAELTRAVRDEETKIPPHMRTQSNSAVGNGGGGAIDTEKLHLAHALRAQQAGRDVLVADIITAQSLAGSSNGNNNTAIVNGGGSSSAGEISTAGGHQENGADGTGTTSSISGEQRHDLYKRLITGALGVRAEDIESLLPEIMRELEDAQDDAATAMGVVTASGIVGLDGTLDRGLVDGTNVAQMPLGMSMSMQGIETGLNSRGTVTAAAG